MRRWPGAFFLFVGSILALAAWTKAKEAKDYRETGVEAKASVSRKELLPASRKGPHQTVYRFSYRFQAVNGQQFERSVTVDAERWEAIREGDFVPVIYLPKAPEKVRLISELQLEDGKGEAAGALLAMLVGSVLLWMPLPQAHVERPQPSARLGILKRIWRGLGVALFWTVVIIAAAGLAETPLFQSIDGEINARSQLYFGIALALLLSGLGLFLGSLLVRMVSKGQSSDAFTLLDLKEAARNGELWKGHWRFRLCVSAGALTMGLGIAALLFVIAPGWLKVMTLAAVAYVGIRIGIGLSR